MSDSARPVPNMPDANPYSAPMGVPLYPLYGYDNIQDLDNDFRYMQYLYPCVARQVQKEVSKECEKLDYEGSFIFDEYPDKVSFEKLANRIYQNLKVPDVKSQLEAKSISYYSRRNRSYLKDIVTIVLLNEIFNRRRGYRCRKCWY